MAFLSPIWLCGLLPWAGLTLWLLWGRLPRAGVPFVALWQISALEVRAKRNLQTPPLALALVIVSLLLGVLAAAGPVAREWGGQSDIPITVLLDRGASMSAQSRDPSAGHYRFQTVAHRLARQLTQTGGASLPIRLIDLATRDDRQMRADQLAGRIDQLPPTLVDTHDALQSALLDAAHQPADPIVIITDQPIAESRPSLVRLAPTDAVRNLSITDLVLRRSPVAQIMVRVKNDGVDASTATLQVSSGDWKTAEKISLPAMGQERDYFVDADHPGDVTRADLAGISDDFPADDHREVVREGNWAHVDARTPLSPALSRLLNSYRAHRPTVPQSPTVAIVSKTSDLADNTAGLILEVPDAAQTTPIAPIATLPHALTRSVDFSALPTQLRVAPDAPSWEPIVSGGGHVLVAARDEPARQVWVGFDPGAWAGSPDFVVFFSTCLDWLAAGGAGDASHPLSELDQTWQRVDSVANPMSIGPEPGVYRRADGTIRAFELPSVLFVQAHGAAVTADVDRIIRSRRPGVQLSGDLLIAAIFCLAGAAFTWRGRRASEGWLAGQGQAKPNDELALIADR